MNRHPLTSDGLSLEDPGLEIVEAGMFTVPIRVEVVGWPSPFNPLTLKDYTFAEVSWNWKMATLTTIVLYK